MAQTPGGPYRKPAKAANDIYTALLGFGLFTVASALGFVIYRTHELLGTPFPSFDL